MTPNSEASGLTDWIPLTEREPEHGALVEVMSTSWSSPRWLVFDAIARRLRDVSSGLHFWYPERMKWRPSAHEAKRPPATTAEAVCKTCGGSRIVDDGEIDQGFENGPIKCVKDCPACTHPAPSTTVAAGEARELVNARQQSDARCAHERLVAHLAAPQPPSSPATEQREGEPALRAAAQQLLDAVTEDGESFFDIECDNLRRALAAPSPAVDAGVEAKWMPMHEDVPAVGTECVVIVRYSMDRPPFAAIDTWDVQREDPTGMGGPTIDTGEGWNDNYETDVIAWMPVPPHPPADWDQRIDPDDAAIALDRKRASGGA